MAITTNELIERLVSVQRKYRGPWTKKPNKRPGYIYVLKIDGNGLYKIGFSKHVGQRVRDLQLSNPHIRKVFAVQVGDMKREEDVLHKRYVRKWVNREFFRLSDSDLKEIRAYLDEKHLPERTVEARVLLPQPLQASPEITTEKSDPPAPRAIRVIPPNFEYLPVARRKRTNGSFWSMRNTQKRT